MNNAIKLPLITLIALISFASVNAVLFTPSLPDLVQFFEMSTAMGQQTITWFLIGYAIGQLMYGPFANRLGRKPALYIGISLQILSSLLCALSAYFHSFPMLIIGRFFCALGAGIGLKMTFTLINECYSPKIASQKIAYLMLAFAITPALAVAVGGVLNTNFGWVSCFYAGALYGMILFVLVSFLPETQKIRDYNALNISHIVHEYRLQFTNPKLVAAGILMGGSTCFVYVFAALAPFIAINLYGMSSAEYGFENLIPSLGLIGGSLLSSRLVTRYRLESLSRLGILICFVGVVALGVALLFHLQLVLLLFFPVLIIYLGISLVLPAASTVGMAHVTDKAHGSSVMNFINMGIATVAVLSLGLTQASTLLLFCTYFIICLTMILVNELMLVTSFAYATKKPANKRVTSRQSE